MIAKKVFGRTGHLSTRALFGAAALGGVTQAEADRTMEVLFEHGINHIDTAASYGNAEIRLGPWMAKHRNDVFLATKTGERTYEKAKEEIHRSLERMRVSNFDLIQLHNLAEEDEWQVAMGPGGALEAAIEAKQQGLVKYIGVTGHGWGIAQMHYRSLQRYDFDSVLLPYSYILVQNAQYASDFEKLLQLCQSRNVAVQTIKSITQRPWGDDPHTAATWYKPLTDQADIDLAAHWVLGNAGVFLNTVGDIHVLPKVLDAVSRFERRPDEDQMQRLVAAREMAPLFV
jgi:aryl-alcohol dehydrogenase-like predicted oxidoreductase